MIIDSTNAVMDLENDLMKSLMGISKPNFPIDNNFPWIAEAQAQINQMFEENIKEPLNILQEYKKYEYLLNVDKRELTDSLFNNKELLATKGTEKADIKDIRETILSFHHAVEEISNLSNDWIDTPMFRVQASSLKEKLANTALNIRNHLIAAVTKWSNDTVNHIEHTFQEMEVTIRKVPVDEKELVQIREFIKVSRDVTQIQL